MFTLTTARVTGMHITRREWLPSTIVLLFVCFFVSVAVGMETDNYRTIYFLSVEEQPWGRGGGGSCLHSPL